VDALAEKKGMGTGVVKLAPVVTLDGLRSGAKLGRGVGNEGRECAESVRFDTKRKSPHIINAIVKNDQIIFVTRHTNHWRCPQFTLYKIKLIRRTRMRSMERQSNVTPKLTSMS
jgi:hypothetical protein